MKYRTIVADPPWPIADPRRRPIYAAGGRRRRGTALAYDLMTCGAIAELPIASLAEADAHLFLWCTRRVFREGEGAAIARAWGFEPIGEIIWGLRNPGFGSGFIGNDHEPVLIARRGSIGFTGEFGFGGVHFWRQTYAYSNGRSGKVHSAKPRGFTDLIESVSPGPYVEVFAREHRLGWDVWGNESANTAHMEVG